MPRKVSLKTLRQKAWKALSLYVRKSSANAAGNIICYTCGNHIPWKESQASHAIPGRTNSVLFDLDIIRPCCVACNMFKGGNLHVFATRLIQENGMQWWQDKLVASRHIVKYIRADYIQLREDFEQKTEALKK